MREPKLDEAEVAALLAAPSGPDWQLRDGTLVTAVTCDGFAGAMAFVAAVALAAEQADHHPDIDIRYDRVLLALVTHDSGGITRKDLDLAEVIDRITEGRR